MRPIESFSATETTQPSPIVGEKGVLEYGTSDLAAGPFFRYGVYGISLRSSIRLSLPEPSGVGPFSVELRIVPPSFFPEVLGATRLQRVGRCSYQFAHLQDGSSYVRWESIGEFLVSGGGRFITCARFPGASMESFQVYLLGQALSFALVKNGFEPVHATCVVIDGEAVAFLGNSGLGKSTLAAFCLQAGDRLLTDDLLLVRQGINGLEAYPGPPRIKLMPGVARRFLGRRANGVQMNPRTRKKVIPLEGSQVCSAPVPLRALYALAHPGQAVPRRGIHIRQLSPKAAFVILLSHAFNYVILDGDRLQRQFNETMRLAHIAPLSELSYPRRVGALTAVRKAILVHLKKQKPEVSA